MMDRVGKMLGLQAKRLLLLVDDASFALERSVQEVGRVELHARLGREHLEHPPALGLAHPGGQGGLLAVAAQHVVVVIAAGLALDLGRSAQPMVVGLVKSSGVPLTGLISPVGINVSSTGVY